MIDGPILSLGEALVEFMPEPAGGTMRRAPAWRKYAGGGPATYAAAAVRCDAGGELEQGEEGPHHWSV